MSRHLYLAPLPQFVNDVLDANFVDLLSMRLAEVGSTEASQGELQAWRRSLPELADVLRRPELDGRLRALDTLRFRRQGALVELEWAYDDLPTWAQARHPALAEASA